MAGQLVDAPMRLTKQRQIGNLRIEPFGSCLLVCQGFIDSPHHHGPSFAALLARLSQNWAPGIKGRHGIIVVKLGSGSTL
jgi:hypothetical protein